MNRELYSYLKQKIDINLDDFYKDLSFKNVIADLFVSNICQLKCRHCYFGETQNIDNELTINEWTQTIDKLYQIGIRQFHFSGKESSICKDTIPLIKYIKEKSATSVGLVTNGLGKVEYYDNIFKEGIDYLEFSIDGDSISHNYIRNADAYSKVINCIHYLDKYCEKINITTCLNKLNHKTYFDMLEDIYSHFGITKYFVTPLYIKGTACSIKNLSLTIQEYSSFIERSISFLQQNPNKRLRLRFCVTEEFVEQIWNNSPFLKKLIINSLDKGTNFIYPINGNVLQISFLFFNIDYITNISITNDGYIIPCADDISNTLYNIISLGNIRNMDSDTLFIKRKKHIINQISNLINIFNEL